MEYYSCCVSIHLIFCFDDNFIFYFKLRWYYDDKPIEESDFKSYHIKDISPDANGKKISCEATNSVGTTRIDKILNVECM